MMVGPTNWRTVSTSPVVKEGTGVELKADVGADADVGIGFDAGEEVPLSFEQAIRHTESVIPRRTHERG
jgi:hypothetical protein